MRELGFTDDELVSAGISVRREGRVYDMFRQRAIFPIIDAQGRVLGFGGRALGDVKPKYLNTGGHADIQQEAGTCLPLNHGSQGSAG